jgi:diacylglycerol kinase (ATP)
MADTRPMRWRNKNLLIAFRHAIEGIAHTFRTQRNMRVHYLLMIAVLFAGLILRLPRVEMIALVFSSALVVLAEMFNTAIEAVVDMITDVYHPAAKYAKDVAAGAVLIAAINASVVGGMIFFSYLHYDVAKSRMQTQPTIPMIVASLLLLLVIVLLGKILGVKGSLLKGGAVSGHAAIAFFVATAIALMVNNALIGLLSLGLAALVGQSRIEGKIHTVREVVTGALLAVALCVIVFRGPAVLARLLP